MDSGGGGGVNDSESGGNHHRKDPFDQSCSSNKNDHQNPLLIILSKSVIRRTIYFIAFASACLLLYLTLFSRDQYYLPISDDPLSSRQSLPPDVGNFSAPTGEFFQVNSTSVSNNSSPGHIPMHDFLLVNSTRVSNISTPGYAPPSKDSFLPGNSSSSLKNASTDEFLQGNNSSTMYDPTDDFIQENSAPASNNSSPMHAPTDDFLGGNSSPASDISPEKLAAPVYQEPEKSKLEKMLSEAAMDDKTVIVTTVNAAWTAPNSVFDLFLESFKIGNETQKLLKHLVVIALDQKGYSRCLELHPHCVALTTEGLDFSGEKFFMTEDYVKLVWRKIEFVYTVLQMGYNSIFTDADILWFRDPFSHFLEDADIQTASDHYLGAPTEGIANTGFYYVKSNSRTVQFYKFWLASKDKIPPENDQEVFNQIMIDPFIEQTGIKIRLLSTAFYGGFCEPISNLSHVCTMHANCCIGIDRKLHDLKMLIEDWKKYMALPSEEKVRTPQTWTVPRWCG